MKYFLVRLCIITLIVLGLLIGCVPANNPNLTMPDNRSAATREFPSLIPSNTPTATHLPTIIPVVHTIVDRCAQIQPNTDSDLPKGRIVLSFQDVAGGGTYFSDLSSQTLTLIGKRILDESVSPDGKLLAYWELDTKSVIIKDNLGQEITVIPDSDELLTPIIWLDNNRLLLTKRLGDRSDIMAPLPSLIIYNPFTNEKQEWFANYPNIETDPNLRWEWLNHFVVNPQLTYIVYPVSADYGPLVIWDIGNKQEVGRVNTGLIEPSFSPDGNQFVVPIWQGDFLNSTGTDLFLVGMNGQTTRLTYFTDQLEANQKGYEWSPDGKQIAFLLKIGSQVTDNSQLAVISLDTFQVTNYCITGASITWSPDGRYILLHQNISDSGKFALTTYIVRLEDGISWKISENSYPDGWMIEPDSKTPSP